MQACPLISSDCVQTACLFWHNPRNVMSAASASQCLLTDFLECVFDDDKTNAQSDNDIIDKLGEFMLTLELDHARRLITILPELHQALTAFWVLSLALPDCANPVKKRLRNELLAEIAKNDPAPEEESIDAILEEMGKTLDEAPNETPNETPDEVSNKDKQDCQLLTVEHDLKNLERCNFKLQTMVQDLMRRILSSLSVARRKAILAQIKAWDNDVYTIVGAHGFLVFADLADLDDRIIQFALREISNMELLLSLKGAPTAVQEKIYSNMSKRAAAMLRDDYECLGPVRLKDVEDSQEKVLRLVEHIAAL